jgi:hypothetical protein|tara:strand:- start:202738 stop:204270 length:1533 start_codon:yes stop_codon:yes gene_type:complete
MNLLSSPKIKKMQKRLLLGALIMFSTFSFGQWEQVGNDIQGENDFDFTGTSVTINDQGNRIAVFDALDDLSPLGKVRFFNLQGNSWVQFGNEISGLPADNISSGTIKFNASGDRLIFSSRLHNISGQVNVGGVRVFELQGADWVQLGSTILGNDEGDLFGNSIDINNSGDRILIGATQGNSATSMKGYAEAYELQSDEWVLLGNRLEGFANGDRFGTAVAMNGIGDNIAISAPQNDEGAIDAGKVKIYSLQGNNWIQQGNDLFGQESGDRMGGTVEQGANPLSFNNEGNILAIGSRLHNVFGFQEGQVRVFQFDGSNWTQRGSDIDGNENNRNFGVTLALNSDGNRLIVGDNNGFDNGSVSSFQFENGNWTPIDEVLVGTQANEFFGLSLDLNAEGDILITGALGSNLYGQSRGYARTYGNDVVLAQSSFISEFKPILYPNPNNGVFNIDFPDAQELVTVNIIDLLGKQVVKIEYFNTKKVEVNENLKAGVYLVEISAANTSETIRIVVE